MTKNKIPIWENIGEYLPELDFLIESLIAFSDKDFQIRTWLKNEGPESSWYNECSITFEEDIDYFKDCIRMGKIVLTKRQIKAILKIHVMYLRFEDSSFSGKWPEDWSERNMFIIEHPYWDKIRKQACYALSLIKK